MKGKFKGLTGGVVHATLGILFCFGFLIPDSSGLNAQNVSLVFGSPIKEGDDLKMLCLFSIPRGTTIYTVKWYKGNREIFRYMAKDGEKQQVPFLDLTIDEHRSDMHTLILKRVPAYMSGNLSCDVTPEPPHNFVKKTLPLLVVVPPKEKMRLGTSLGMTNSMLLQNQKLSANCTSSPSKPAVNITFYINDLSLRPDDPNIGIRMHREELKDDWEVSFAELELQLQPQYFKDGKIRLKCGGSLFNIHNSFSDEFFGQLGKPKSPKQGSFFGSLGGAPQIQSGSLTVLTQLFSIINLRRLLHH